MTIASGSIVAKKKTMMVLGYIPNLHQIKQDHITVQQYDCDELTKIDPEVFTAKQPDIVLSSPFGTNTDCIELAIQLSNLKFQGTFVVLSDMLPNPNIVAQELKQLCTRSLIRVLPRNEIKQYI